MVDRNEEGNLQAISDTEKEEKKILIEKEKVVDYNPSSESNTMSKETDENKIAEQISIIESKSEQRSKSATKSKKISRISDGDLLEYRLKRLIFFMGYYPQVGIKIKSSSDEQADIITDLDVYGFYIHKNFTSKTIWADCKSGQARPLERISWILGIKNIVGIEDVIFVKKGVRIATKQFARKSGIQILDLEVLEKLERDYKIEHNDWRGSWNLWIQLNQLVTLQKIDIPSKERYKKIGNFISYNYWTLDDYTKVKKTITALKQLAEVEQYPLQQEQIMAVHWAIYKLSNLFVQATLNICKELYYYSDRDKEETILEGLVSGEISTKKRAEIVDATYKLAYNLIRQHMPSFDGILKIPNLGGDPPKYFEAYNNLIQRITNNPLDYFDILRFMDFMTMEYDLQAKNIEDTVLKSMFPNYDNLVISTKTIIHFLCSITNIRKDIFQLTK